MIHESLRKLKVAHLTSVHPAWDTRIAYRECASLADAGYEVVLIAPGTAEELPRGVRLRSVPRPRGRLERMSVTVWNVYRAALEERADVYHFHDPELMGVGLALRASGAHVVFDVHEDIPQDIADKPWIAPVARRPIAALSALALRAFNSWYSAIVTATPTIARRFPHRRTIVVANYPRIEELPVSGTLDFSARPRSVVYLGAITELRCVTDMVGALESPLIAPDVRLTLAGHFESEELERTVRAMPGWRRVDYSGFARRAEVARIFASARAGMLLFRPALNHEDAMPTKLFEYLGAGLPVIISDTLRCSEIVRQNDCGIVVNPLDRDAVAGAINFLIDNPAAAQEMGARGRRIVTERYQWNSEAKKLTKLYAEIA